MKFPLINLHCFKVKQIIYFSKYFNEFPNRNNKSKNLMTIVIVNRK